MDLKQFDLGDDLADYDKIAEAVNPHSRDMPNNIEYVRLFSKVFIVRAPGVASLVLLICGKIGAGVLEP